MSQIFGDLQNPTFQGEGNRAGVQTIFLRLFGCSLKCPGFFQPNPTDKSTYHSPINIDPSSIKTLKDMPVVEYGCDTLYAIDPRFKHLREGMEVDAAVIEILSRLPNEKFVHPKTGNHIDLCITGGEPLLQQKALGEFLMSLDDSIGLRDLPYEYPLIQIETNGTTELTTDFKDILFATPFKIQFNVSPKLFNVAGEKDAWNYEAIANYSYYGDVILKIVMNNREESWYELDGHIEKLKENLYPYNLPSTYIMPVGSSYAQQSDYKVTSQIVRRALKEGYHISGRLQSTYLGNAVDV